MTLNLQQVHVISFQNKIKLTTQSSQQDHKLHVCEMLNEENVLEEKQKINAQCK